MDLSTIAINGVIIVPLITALIQMCKAVGLVDKYCPIISVIIGIVLGVFYVVPSEPMTGLLVGIAMGLASCGLYDNYNQLKK